jgi:glycosyltransferase involved in cell wall biosynthesis
LRILHVTSDWKWTGPAEPMLHAVSGLRKRGHTAELACPAPPEGVQGALLERARARGVEPVLRLERGQGYHPWNDRGQVRALRECITALKYDVVHVHHTRDHLLVRAATWRTRTPLVASWHHGEPIPRRFWNRWLYGPRGCDALTLLSDALARDSRWLGGAPERLAVVPGVVDTELFAPRERSKRVAEELGLEADARVIGVVARLQPHRRFDLLLEGFRIAQRKLPQLKLVVVGRGTRAQQVLEEPVQRLGLGAHVIRAGYRGGDYRDILALFDALVFLVPGSDGSCRAVLEAMALGIPVIASPRGVLPETVDDGETGAVVEEDAEALAREFVRCAREPGEWQRRGAAARERAVARHRIELQAERLEALYRALVPAA